MLLYKMLAGKITLALGVYMERTFGYTAIIRDDTTHRKFQDDIHITISSYFSLTQHITQHVFEHIHKPAREPQALVYNWDFLNQERAYTQGRDINNSTPARRGTNINTNHSNRATSSSSTQTLDTCREKRGRKLCVCQGNWYSDYINCWGTELADHPKWCAVQLNQSLM